ncbi:MAG: LLM class flavin-dependent oxidoreductase [Myxococcota bacterium]|nr:LLM class flavin-dependent oxidoreductase [Myxococcota bacterium]
MILDMSSELQKPEGMPEPQLYAEALEQVVLADELGDGCWWSVEHHDTGHFSDCSTSDLMLTLISQHSEQIHLGHSGVLAPFDIHHPMQIAERAAFLDSVSRGRLELGLARSLPREWETFGGDPDETRQQAGHDLDPLEVCEALEPFDAVIIGDVDTCRRKLERYAECGVDRLMCLMQMGPVPHETVMKSIRTAGKHLVPQLAAFERSEA